MTDQSFHEIQLSGKQLVFVFMSAVVVAVVIFLLGVSVGRGVRTSLPGATSTSAAAGSTGEAVAPTAAAPGSPPPAGASGLSYHDVLQGKDAAGKAVPPASGATSPPPAPPQPTAAPLAPPPAATGPAGTKSGVVKDPKPTPATPAEAKPTATKSAPEAGAKIGAPGTGGLFVQLGVYKTKENADKQVEQLKSKGYAAFVFAQSGPVALFHVRIGPFADQPEAEGMRARLAKEGMTSFITR